MPRTPRAEYRLHFLTGQSMRRVQQSGRATLVSRFPERDEKFADACIVDACTIAQTQTPIFHEWLVYWAARATLLCAFQRQHAAIAELVPEYEKGEPVEVELPPLSAEYFRLLIKSSEDIRVRLDVLCPGVDTLNLAS